MTELLEQPTGRHVRLTMDDFVPRVDEIISVGEFYEKAAGGQIIFT